ncbi:MAG: DUF433 domain-containing protein [Terracidiphilus sp.]|jgi:uncharacterized protein (DUF433 family)
MKRRIISDPEILSGTPVFRGTRIPLEHVVGLIRKGVSGAELKEDFPALTKADFSYARRQARARKGIRQPRKSLEIRKTPKAA